MLRLLALMIITVIVGIAVAPRLIPVLTWVLAFLSVLMAADLLLAALRKRRDSTPRR